MMICVFVVVQFECDNTEINKLYNISINILNCIVMWLKDYYSSSHVSEPESSSVCMSVTGSMLGLNEQTYIHKKCVCTVKTTVGLLLICDVVTLQALMLTVLQVYTAICWQIRHSPVWSTHDCVALNSLWWIETTSIPSACSWCLNQRTWVWQLQTHTDDDIWTDYM